MENEYPREHRPIPRDREPNTLTQIALQQWIDELIEETDAGVSSFLDKLKDMG